MSLTYGLQTPRDLLEKLKRDAELLGDEVTSDRFFNFVITGYSLIDWIKNDPAGLAAAKSAAKAMYDDPWIKVCGDLATASKHFILTTRKAITAETESLRGWGRGRWGKGSWGRGEEDIQLELNDGTTVSCLELAENVVNSWEQFFATNNL